MHKHYCKFAIQLAFISFFSMWLKIEGFLISPIFLTLHKSHFCQVVEPISSLPVSDGLITPYIIPGENNGGNRTCAEVAKAWHLDTNPFSCGEKINYEDGEWDGDFPAWLEVNVADDGKISFEVLFGCHKIGAVIVKGSNAANVYYYGLVGSTGDDGLYAPDKKMVSNLTFCCIPCEEELIIAIKSIYMVGQIEGYAVSSGAPVFSNGNWCEDWNLGVYDYVPNTSFKLTDPYSNEVGTADIDANGEVNITLNIGLELLKLMSILALWKIYKMRTCQKMGITLVVQSTGTGWNFNT